MSPIALSVKSAAAALDLSESMVRKAIDKQELPAHRIGTAIRIYEPDLREWFLTRALVGSDADR